MNEKISKEEALSFLQKHPIMSIAINGDPMPISSVILFHTYDDFSFVFGTGEKSYKSRALMEDPRISYSVWVQDELLIQGGGEASMIESEEEVNIALDDLVKSTNELHHFWPPLLGVWKRDYVVFRVTPKWVRVLDVRNANIKSKGPKFTEFNF